MRKVDLTQGNVFFVLLSLTIPIVGSSFLQFTYSLVDMLWLGSLGSDSVASVGSSSFFINLGYAINTLVVVGTGIKVSHSLGKNDDEQVKSYINVGIFINFILATLYSLALIFFGDNLIEFLGIGDKNVEREAYLYLIINAPVIFFAFFDFLYIRILNSYGHNSQALKISVIGVVINIILDPIFILKFGALGAGIATLIANMVMFFMFLVKFKELFKYHFEIPLNKEKILEIISLGIPMTTQRVLFNIVNISLAKIISNFGAEAIAGQKIGLQIESITFMIIGGLNGAVASFIGQNYGAKEYKRIIKGYNIALKMGICYALITSSLFLIFSDNIVSIFIKDTATIQIASMYIKIVAFAQIFSAIEMVSNGMFTGLGMPKIPATISIIFTVLRIPMALVLIKYYGVNGVWLSISMSSVLKGIFSYIMYILKVRKDKNYA